MYKPTHAVCSTRKAPLYCNHRIKLNFLEQNDVYSTKDEMSVRFVKVAAAERVRHGLADH